MKKLSLSLLMGLACQAPLNAQELGLLRPTRPLPAPGGQLEVRFQRSSAAGSRTLAFPRPEERNWIFLRAPRGQSNFQAVPTLGAEQQRGQLALPAGGYGAEGVVIGLDLKPTVQEVTLEEWQAFQVARLGVQRPADFTSAFETPGRVRLRRVESMKLLLRLEEGRAVPVPSGVLMTKTGQACELRPLADPTTITPGGDLPVKVYTPTGSAAGLVVTAVHEASGARSRAVTRPGGIAHLRLGAAGAWTVEFHELLPLGGTRGADFELRSASLRFVSPAADGSLEAASGEEK